MNRQKAAAYLGVSVRTLDKYRKEGRLTARYEKGKTRPVVLFDDGELARLKAELDATRTPMKPAASAAGGSRPRVQFRMDAHHVEQLTAEGARYGMTAGEYARQLVREGLDASLRVEVTELRDEVGRLSEEAPQAAVARLQAELEPLRAELKRLRLDFAESLEAVLEFVGVKPEKAAQWVKENLGV